MRIFENSKKKETSGPERRNGRNVDPYLRDPKELPICEAVTINEINAALRVLLDSIVQPGSK